MDSEKIKVVPNERELTAFDLNDPSIIELIHHAQQGDEADRLLTVRAALKKYKIAVFWAMLLSTSLIMEGYDLVIVGEAFHFKPKFLLISIRLPPSMAKHNFAIVLALWIGPLDKSRFLQHGNQVCQIQVLLDN